MSEAGRPFLRHTPSDPEALPGKIIDAAGTLVALLTAARREGEAYALGLEHLAAARANPTLEASAWLLHHLATAAQYVGKRREANDLFAEALRQCRQHGWRRLEHFVLHHWGRSRAEEGDYAAAEDCFMQSRQIRLELDDPLVASSDRALAELARIR